MRQNEHGRIIAAAAKAHLSPLGCRRKGRSRVWQSDERFWQIGIEFQPSGWSKGSYLNAGASWLWNTRPKFTYATSLAASDRIAGFAEFKTGEQFAPAADRLAARAAEEVRALRCRFHSLPAIAHELETRAESGNNTWPAYNAAVAAGLVGRASTARRLFDRVVAVPINDEMASAAAWLASCLGDPSAYRRAVLDVVEQCRLMRRLPPDPTCLDDAISSVE